MVRILLTRTDLECYIIINFKSEKRWSQTVTVCIFEILDKNQGRLLKVDRNVPDSAS